MMWGRHAMDKSHCGTTGTKRGTLGRIAMFLWFCLAVHTAAQAQTRPLNDTGQTLCYNAANAGVACTAAVGGDTGVNPRQDGRFGRDAQAAAGGLTKVGGGVAGFDFTKVCMSGQSVGTGTCLATAVENRRINPASNDWACSRDNLTGLVWSLYEDNSLYDFQSAASVAAGSNAGNHNASARCGYNDWRMPTAAELMSIHNYQTDGIDFLPGRDGHNWASERRPIIDGREYAWTFTFGSSFTLPGALSVRPSDSGNVAILVRGSTTSNVGRYTINSTGTVADSITGLTWDRCALGQTGNTCAGGTASTLTWVDALATVTSLNAIAYKGHNDWRLPNVKELASIVDLSLTPNSGIFVGVFEAISTSIFSSSNLAALWSSTTTPLFSASNAWGVTWFGEVRSLQKSISSLTQSDGQVGGFGVRVVRNAGVFDALGVTPIDTTPPVINAAQMTVSPVVVNGVETAATNLQVLVSANENAGVFWVVVANNAVAPTVAQITAGISYSGTTVLERGVVGITTPNQLTSSPIFAFSNLLRNTPYKGYLVAQDTAGNYGNIQTVNVGLFSATNGVCGAANGVVTATAPTTGLCSAGTANPATLTGSGPWSWTCNGSGGGTNDSCNAAVANVPSSISLSRSTLRVGRTSTITPTPIAASVATCTSSNNAVATIAAGVITGVARGDVDITCGAATAKIYVRNPRVYSVVPEGGHAYMGFPTTFVVTGRDLDGPLRFSISACLGQDVDPDPIDYGRYVRPVQVNRRFTCVPAGNTLGVKQVTISPWDKVPEDWARGQPSSTLETPGCDQAFVGCTVTIESEIAQAQATQAAKDAAIETLRIQHAIAATGLIPWDNLTNSDLALIGTALRNAGVSTAMPAELQTAQANALANVDVQTTAHAERVGGTLTGFSLPADLVPGSGFYTGWARYSVSGMSGGEWFKLSAGIAAETGLAVLDVITLGNATAATKIAKTSRTGATALKKWMRYQSATANMQKWARGIEKLSFLAEVAVAGVEYSQLSDEERSDMVHFLTTFGPVLSAKALEKVPALSNWVDAGGPGAGLTAEVKKAILAVSIDALFKLPGKLFDEGVSAAALGTLAQEMALVAVDAVPVVGRWKSVYEMSAAFAGKQAGSVFGTVDKITDMAVLEKTRVFDDFRRLKYRIIFDEVDYRLGQSALIRTPMAATQLLPAAGFNQPPADIKRVVVVTHGWNSDAATWPTPLVNTLCARRGLPVAVQQSNPTITSVASWCNAAGWLIVSVNWAYEAAILNRSAAGRDPTEALAQAYRLARLMAADFAAIGVRPELLHVIGHSAGSGFVDELTTRMKAANSALISHNTFLDAYCPSPWACDYGASASWAEQYVDSRFSFDPSSLLDTASVVTPRQTDVTLGAAYSFDVTSLDPQQSPSPTTAIDNHAWPYRLYSKSAGTALPALPYAIPGPLTNIGPVLSAVWSGQTVASGWLASVPTPLRATGKRCVVNSLSSTGSGAGCASEQLAPIANALTTGAGSTLPGAANLLSSSCFSQVGATSTTRLQLGCVGALALAGKAVTSPTSAVRPATVRYVVNLTGPTNQFQAVLSFAGTDADANMALYIDDLMVYSKAARAVSSVLSSWVSVPDLAPGEHTVQWVFTGAIGTVDVLSLSFRLKSAAPSVAQYGACGSANNTAGQLVEPPISGLCTAGIASAAVPNGDYWGWQCTGTGAPSLLAAASCWAGISICDRDVDGNGTVDSHVDGVLLSRYLMGFRGTRLIAGLTIPGPRNSAAAIETFLGDALQFDVVGRQPKAPSALVDGLLHLRVMQGLPDAGLLAGIAIPAGARVSSAAGIRANALAGCKVVEPTVTSISPLSGARGTYAVLRVTGTNLPSNRGLLIPGISPNCVAIGTPTATVVDFQCLIQPVVGRYLLTVVTDKNALYTSPAIGPTLNFTVRTGSPSITSFSPVSRGGQFALTVTGVDMPYNLAVDIGGVSCNAPRSAYSTDGLFSCNVSSLPSGYQTVTVRDAPGGAIMRQFTGTQGFLVP